MFDHDRKTGQIRQLCKTSQLIAWITEKSGHPVSWKAIDGAVSQEQFYESVNANIAKQFCYNSISDTPHFPVRDDVYYTHEELPEPTPDARYLEQFIDFFAPETHQDRMLIKAMACTPLYCKEKIAKPLFIIDSHKAQANGKSTLVNMIALLYGSDLVTQSPMSESFENFMNDNQLYGVRRRMMSTEARRKRIYLLDNVDKFFKSAAFAELITSDTLTGIKPYGHQDETRPNDYTFVMTVNGANVDQDLASRALQIFVSMPEHVAPNWEFKVVEYAKTHRMQILSDMLGLMKRGAEFEAEPFTRFRQWERDILQPVVGTLSEYDAMFKNDFRQARRN